MEINIFDPSYKMSEGYWQLQNTSNSDILKQWDSIAKQINRNLPTNNKTLFECIVPVTNMELWGCLRLYDYFWLYRVYFTGRDRQSRPGRYFFVVFRSQAAEDLRTDSVGKILQYLESQTSIPIETKPITNLIASPTGSHPTTMNFDEPHLRLVLEKAKTMSDGEHQNWVLEGTSVIDIREDSVPVDGPSLKSPVELPDISKPKKANPRQDTEILRIPDPKTIATSKRKHPEKRWNTLGFLALIALLCIATMQYQLLTRFADIQNDLDSIMSIVLDVQNTMEGLTSAQDAVPAPSNGVFVPETPQSTHDSLNRSDEMTEVTQ